MGKFEKMFQYIHIYIIRGNMLAVKKQGKN